MEYKKQLVKWAARREKVRVLRDEIKLSFSQIAGKFRISPQEARHLYLKAKKANGQDHQGS